MTAPEVIAENPEKGFPIPFELPDGYAWVQEVMPPAYSRFTARLEVRAELIGDTYTQVWEVIPLAEEDTAQMLADTKAKLVAEAANLKWQKETSGITLPGGLQIATDRESQAMVGSAYSSLKNGLIEDTPWKGSNGWVTVTLAEIEPLAKLVAEHVRGCFAAEKAHQECIENLTLEDALSYNLNTGWPT